MAVESVVTVICDGTGPDADGCYQDAGDPFHTIEHAITALRPHGWTFSNRRNAAGNRLAFCPTCSEMNRRTRTPRRSARS